MASHAPLPPHATAAPVAAEARFLLRDGALTVRLVDAGGATIATIHPDAAALTRLGRSALSMAAMAEQLDSSPHLSAGRDIPLFARADLRPAERAEG